MNIDIDKLNEMIDAKEKETFFDLGDEEKSLLNLERTIKKISKNIFSDQNNLLFAKLYINKLREALREPLTYGEQALYREGLRFALELFESFLHSDVKIKLLKEEGNGNED
jgi:hypothetical protein